MCNQCGTCCKMEVCEIGVKMFGTDKTPCPGLIYRDKKFWCGVVIFADKEFPDESKILHVALGIGYGCDSPMP